MTPILHDSEDWRGLLSDMHELQIAQGIMKVKLENLNQKVGNLAVQREKDHEANINVQLEIASGQGSIRTLLIVGGGIVGLVNIAILIISLMKH
jgi:hypothetical protein